MRTHNSLTLFLFLFIFSAHSQTDRQKVSDTVKNATADTFFSYRPDGTISMQIPLQNGVKSGNALLLDEKENIVGIRHYENDTLNGFGLLLNENTYKPKYIYQSKNGKPQGVLIDFYDNGIMKKFRTADIFNDSQILRFHENGVIKEIGQTKMGKAHGTFFYFDVKGKLEKKVEYKEGNVVK
ncbi:toxin-antitoxin system YwqK family antitoxin [Aequorivita sinensis]|uniref:toxin-antitoxin system YwqK family antitoxin n=1 Tax=Aequorivita sinensis TaxID=1382458 RepID=UPI00112484B7|nr:hypothetical protein [Aequorivita sinensis]